MREFQLVNLADLALVGDPAPLPPEFANLSDAVLSDFSAHIDPPPVGYAGKGLLPLVVSAPVFDQATEADTGVPDLASRVVDVEAGIVRAVSGKRPLSAEEIAARAPKPKPLTRLAFVTLVQQAGGMSPALYLQARRDEAFAYLWDMLNFAEEVARDDELTAQALGSLAAGGYLPNGVDAVREAWPAV